jgi:SAM-dependent methyltransferase
MERQDEYSLANATRFGWSSVTANLNPGRTALLDRELVGTRILDAGCGGGGYCNFIHQQGLDVTGVDLHDTFLSLARQNYPHISFITANLTDLPFEDKSFDTVFCFDVLEHVDDVAALRELVRVASKKVVLAVPRDATELLPFNLVFSTYQDTTHQRYYTETSLGDLIKTVDPSAKHVIGSELMLPVALMLPYLCDITRCGYLGTTGLIYRILHSIGAITDNGVAKRGQRVLDKIARHSAKRIPTGLTATIELT